MHHGANQPSQQFKELGDPKSLATLDKIFAIENDPAGYWGHYFCVVDSSAAIGAPDRYGADIGVMPKSRLLPLAIDPGSDWVPLFLPIGDNIPAAAANKTLKSATLTVRLNQPQERLEVKLNGQLIECTEKEAEGRWLRFNVAPSCYKLGENNVSFQIAKAGAVDAPRLEILAVEMHVNYTK